jgi:hypothetical protein
MAPPEGLARVLRARRKSKSNDDLSRPSTAGETSTTSIERVGTRASIDRAIDRFKDNVRNSDDTIQPRRSSFDWNDQPSGKLSRLISRRRRKKAKDDQDALGQERTRPRTVGGPMDRIGSQTLDLTPSEESLHHSGGSSLLTEDSDGEV